MCGIVGLSRSDEDARDRFPAALRALAWRGPDGRQQVDCGEWTLGIARLAITDPSAMQPIHCPVTGRVVVFNGAATSAENEWPEYGDWSETRNDAELLLMRLRRHGPKALLDMTGPYAFALCDPNSGELWLGRDPMGEKPLHVILDEGRVIAFASSITSLRALGYRFDLTAQARARFFRFGFATGKFDTRRDGRSLELRTDLRGLYKVDPEGRLAEVKTNEPMQGHHPAETKDRSFATALAAGVRRCSTAEVPVGLCLSGGVDSSCLAAILHAQEQKLCGYQWKAVGEDDGERRNAHRVATRFGHRLQTVDGTADVLQELPRLTADCGLPLGDPSVLAVHALARQAAADGIKILLSGEGADDLLLGYPRHHAAARLPRRGLPLWSPKTSMQSWARLWRALTAEHPYDALLAATSPGFLHAVLAADPEQKASPMEAELDTRTSAVIEACPETDHETSLDRARRLDRDMYLRWDLLPKLDTALMATGIEGRCPFLDPAVLNCVEVTSAASTDLVGKRPLIEAFGAELPDGICDQKKRGFAIPLDRWIKEDDFLSDILSDRRSLEREHIDAKGVRRLLAAARKGRIRQGRGLYLIAAYEVWLRSNEANP